MLRQSGKYIVHESGDLLVRRVEDFMDTVDERVHDEAERVIERDVRKIVHDGVEEITEALLIRLHPMQISKSLSSEYANRNASAEGNGTAVTAVSRSFAQRETRAAI